MKKQLAILSHLAFAASLLGLSGQAQALTQAEIEAYKASANGISNIARTQSPAVDEEGNVKTDESGKVVKDAPGTASSREQGRYFKSMTGVTGYQNKAEPGRGGRVDATVTGEQFMDFTCASPQGTRKSALGRVFKFDGCIMGSNKTVDRVTLSMCSAVASGGVCGNTDFTQALAYPVDSYHPINDVTIGIGCNRSTQTCRVTVKGTFAIAANGESLKTQGAEKAAADGENSAQGTIKTQYSSDQYTEALTGTATEVNGCAGEISTSARVSGSATTCDKKEESRFTGKTVGGSQQCSDTPVCIRRATRTVNYTTSCERTFSLTGYSCSFSVPKKECTVTKDVVAGTTSSSCTAEDLADGTKVDSSESSATCTATDPATNACVTQTWTEYYTFPSKATLVGECTSGPLPMGGPPAQVCVNKGNGIDGAGTCKAGGWYRRTLSDTECTVVGTDPEDGSEIIQELTAADKEGCGVCIAPITNDSCYSNKSAETCSQVDTSVCTLSGSTSTDSYYGMTTSQKETYSCAKQEESCVEWDRSNMCTNTDMTYGTETSQTTKKSSQNMGQALASAAVIEAIANNTEATDDPFAPKVFSGKDSRCSYPTNFVSNIYSDNCCRTNIARPEGNSDDKCSMDEFKLAAARREKLTHYVGSYCSKKKRMGPVKVCTRRTETYCKFEGLLARVIQEQGRKQLEEMANSSYGAQMEKTGLNFKFYDAAGGWTQPVTVNGVVVTPWQYPSYCSNAEAATKAISDNPSAIECPVSLIQWFAVCDTPTGCGALPTNPELGSPTWLVSSVDPLKNATTAISQYAMVAGACDPASTTCRYEIFAWPVGKGGKAVITRELIFPLFADQVQDAKSIVVPDQLTAVGQYIFRPNSISSVASGSMPQAVLLDYSVDGGNTYLHTPLPTSITGTDYVLPGTDDIRVTGGCDAASNTCQYTLVGTTTVTAKPWGYAKRPDCSGFSLGQLSILDFSAMDLSEWLASVTANLKTPNNGELGTLAANRTQQMIDARNNGTATVSASVPSRTQVARITPHEDFGPFIATVKVTGNWPETYSDPLKNTNPVLGVDIDWGDCTVPDAADPVNGMDNGRVANGWIAQHRYEAPNNVSPYCGGGRNAIDHIVKLKIRTRNGTEEVSLKTTNLWNDYRGASNGVGQGGGGNIETRVTVPAPTK